MKPTNAKANSTTPNDDWRDKQSALAQNIYPRAVDFGKPEQERAFYQIRAMEELKRTKRDRVVMVVCVAAAVIALAVVFWLAAK